MEQCLMVTFTVGSLQGFFDSFVKKQAEDLDLEGVAQLMSKDHVRMVVCGQSNNVDLFIDSLFEKTVKYKLDDIQVESYFRERDYRGVFRVVA